MEDSAISIKFNKKRKKHSLKPSTLRDDNDLDNVEKTEFIVEVNERNIVSNKKVKKKMDLVIPCSSSNSLRTTHKMYKKSCNNLERMAAEELIKDAANPNKNNRFNKNSDEPLQQTTYSIVKNDINNAPMSTLDDYESVPIDMFGIAMLRGMGWKEDTGIGSSNKKVVRVVEPVIRAKGLGLGATRPNSSKIVVSSNIKKDDLFLHVGAFARIESGFHRGTYGRVEGLDEEAARVFIMPAIGSRNTISISENAIVLVTEKEFQQNSRVINKRAYDHAISEINSQTSYLKCSEDKIVNSSSKTCSKYVKVDESFVWKVYPMLRVRCILPDSPYYNTKMVVTDVVSHDRVMCRSDIDGHLVDCLQSCFLETVIPKTHLATVMILRGKYDGYLGQMIERNKRDCKASVQLISEEGTVLKFCYEDICEYTGDVTNDV